MLPYYQPSETEVLICDLYQAFGIEHAHELEIDLIAAIWGADVVYYSGRPCTVWDDSSAVILLNKSASARENRKSFFHELCHIAKHVGRQEELPDLFVELQEIQAAQFQIIAAMPYYLFPEPTRWVWSEYIGLLADTFQVPIELAIRRAQHIESRFHEKYYYLRKYTFMKTGGSLLW